MNGRRPALGLLCLLVLPACAATGSVGSASPSTQASASLAAATATEAGSGIPSAGPTGDALTSPREPTGPLIAGPPLTAEDEDGMFRLTIQSDQDRYRAGQLIDVAAALTYIGPASGTVALGSGSSLVGFRLQRAEPPLRIDPAYTSDCKSYQMVPDAPLEYPFSKSGGFSADDPLAPFYEAYFASPELRLPSGKWTISAEAGFFTGSDCGDVDHSIEAAVTVIVEP